MDQKASSLKAHIEYIIWKDAVSEDPWTEFELIEPSFHLIETVGFLFKENKDSVTIALNHDVKSNSFSCFLHLPKVMIVSRQKIRAVLKGPSI